MNEKERRLATKKERNIQYPLIKTHMKRWNPSVHLYMSSFHFGTISPCKIRHQSNSCHTNCCIASPIRWSRPPTTGRRPNFFWVRITSTTTLCIRKKDKAEVRIMYFISKRCRDFFVLTILLIDL